MKKTTLIAIVLLAVFLVLRLPGIGLPYHQDEWKNVASAESVASAGAFFAHPPLMQMIFVGARNLLGTEHMRLLPLAFSLGAGILLYLIMRRRAGLHAAWWSSALFALCAYNIQGALSPDVDGAILPFFFLLALYAYDRWLKRPLGVASGWWPWLFFGALMLGFLTKLSFVIAMGAFLIDYLAPQWRGMPVKKWGIIVAVSAAFAALYVALLYIIQLAYPAFSISFMLGHAGASAGGAGRNWVQIAVQASKAAYFLSPLLILPAVFTTRDIFRRSRIFFLYIVFGLVFYLGIFDFSRAALDKYLLFLIVPLAAVGGLVLAELTDRIKPSRRRSAIAIGVMLGAFLAALNFLPQTVVPLYPKTAWFSMVVHGHWDILNPFMGGNGPLGFYVSFMFISASFIVSAVLAAWGLFRKEYRATALVMIVVIGIFYNAFFAEEFLWGQVNGSAPQALTASIEYIRAHPEIGQVMTYNDIGAGELSQLGKYAGRIYATPEAEEAYRQKFASFDGDYMVIDMPHLYETGFYARFFAACDVLFETRSGEVSGRVYDCSRARQRIQSI